MVHPWYLQNAVYHKNIEFTCEFSRKLFGRDMGRGVDVPAIAMATF